MPRLRRTANSGLSVRRTSLRIATDSEFTIVHDALQFRSHLYSYWRYGASEACRMRFLGQPVMSNYIAGFRPLPLGTWHIVSCRDNANHCHRRRGVRDIYVVSPDAHDAVPYGEHVKRHRATDLFGCWSAEVFGNRVGLCVVPEKDSLGC